MMKEWLSVITENAIVIIEAMALLIIISGTIEAFINSRPTSSRHRSPPTAMPLAGSLRSRSFARSSIISWSAI